MTVENLFKFGKLSKDNQVSKNQNIVKDISPSDEKTLYNGSKI